MTDQDKLEAQRLADEADWLVNNPSFKSAILKLRQEWFKKMMDLEPQVGSPGYLTALARYASMLAALEAIPRELALIIANHKFDKKVNRPDG